MSQDMRWFWGFVVVVATIAGGFVLYATAPYSLLDPDHDMGWLEAFGTALVSCVCLVVTLAIAPRVSPYAWLVVVPVVVLAIWISHSSGLPWTASIVVAPIIMMIIFLVFALIAAGA